MIIWALALVLLASLGFAGYCFGVIRALFAFFGLLISIVVARIFAHLLVPQMTHLGVKNPFYAWVLAPIIAFLISLAVFKIIGFVVQRKVNLYFKYKAGDLRLALWNRLNARLGLCVGLANALIYLILISVLIYPSSYATTELSTDDNANWSTKLINEAGRELQSTGLAKVAAAMDPMPETFYKGVDLAGLIYHNDLLEARLSRYPAFLSIAQRQEFLDISTDKDFTELRQKQPPISEILNYPKLQVIKDNPDELRELWGIFISNYDDILNFLHTGLSQKYADQKLVGTWDFNINASITSFQAANPNATSMEMRRAKQGLALMYSKTTILASLDNQLFVKNLGKLRMVPATPGANVPPPAQAGGRGGRGGRGGAAGGGAPPRGGAAPNTAAPNMTVTVDMQPTITGTWSDDGLNDYKLKLSNGSQYSATVEGDVLTLSGQQFALTFDREY